MKLIEKINKQKIIKISKYIILFIIVLYTLIAIYSLIFEKDKIAIDNYNFSQLEKAKKILKNLKREDKQFFNLKEFNELYKENIKPIKNCYYIRNYKNINRVPYTFGFKIESLLYKIRYLNVYYTYPKYDLPYSQSCDGKCYDRNRFEFKNTISNPCQD